MERIMVNKLQSSCAIRASIVCWIQHTEALLNKQNKLGVQQTVPNMSEPSEPALTLFVLKDEIPNGPASIGVYACSGFI